MEFRIEEGYVATLLDVFNQGRELVFEVGLVEQHAPTTAADSSGRALELLALSVKAAVGPLPAFPEEGLHTLKVPWVLGMVVRIIEGLDLTLSWPVWEPSVAHSDRGVASPGKPDLGVFGHGLSGECIGGTLLVRGSIVKAKHGLDVSKGKLTLEKLDRVVNLCD